MLGIKKNGFFLDLYPGSIISMEISNTILDDDIVNGSYSFPFKLPLTPHNKRLLGFPEQIASTATIQVDDPVQIWVDGLLIFPNATFKIKDVNPAFINVYILVGISTLAAYADQNKLADKMDYVLAFDTTLLHADDLKLHAKNTLTATVDSYPYVFPMVVNDDHYQNQLQVDPTGYTDHVTYNLYINNQFVVLDQVVVNDQVAEAGLKHAKQTMVPFIYATYILRKVLASLNLSSNVFETDAQLKKLILFNNFAQDKWYPIFTQYFENRNNRTINLREHVPDQTVGQFIVALKKVFCLYFYKDPFNEEIHLDAFKNIIADPDYVDWTSIAVAEYNLEETVDKGLKYLPDIQSDRKLSATISMLNATGRKAAVRREIDLPIAGNSFGDIRMVEETGDLYVYANIFLGGLWLPITNAYGDYYIQPAQFELKNTMPAAVPTKVKFYSVQQHLGAEDYLIPVVGIAGSYESNDSKLTLNPIVTKLLFYHGIKTTVSGRNYPFASSHNYDIQKNRVGEYSLAWDGADGLYNVWWKDYLNMKDATKVVTLDILLTIPDLLNLNLRKKVRIGENTFLIRKLSLQLPLTKPARVTFWKVT